MPPNDFWRATPRIFQVTIEARFRAGIELENRAISNAYYTEAFARTKRLKPLKEYLIDPAGKPKGATIQTPEDMLSILQEIADGGAVMEFKFTPSEEASEGEA